MISKLSGVAGGILAIVSGFFWWQSADLQVQTLTTLATKSPDALAKLSILSANENLWAGEFAAASGLCIALGLFFDKQ